MEKTKTYKEYIKWQMDNLSRWQKFWMYMASNPPSWRTSYLEDALNKILKSENLEEAKEIANIALGRGKHDDFRSTEKDQTSRSQDREETV